MPYIIISSSYPPSIADELVKVYLEVIKKYPPDDKLGKEIVPVAVKATLQGIQTINITEVKKGKLDEALTRAANAMAMYRNVKGYSYAIDVYLTVEEALASVGMG
jgi:hypothetical protein